MNDYTENNSELSEEEKNRLIHIASAMDIAEASYVLRGFSTDLLQQEIIRRQNYQEEAINAFAGVLENYTNQMYGI